MNDSEKETGDVQQCKSDRLEVRNEKMCSTNEGPSGNSEEVLQEIPDLTEFANQRMEEELDKMFINRYTEDNELYAEVCGGFPHPAVVYPWTKKPKRNFDYTKNRTNYWSSAHNKLNWNAGQQPFCERYKESSGENSTKFSVTGSSMKRKNPYMDRDETFH